MTSRRAAQVIRGSALCALEGRDDKLGKDAVLELMGHVDSFIPTPKRETEKAMFDAVEDEKKAKLRERRERNRLEKEERRKQNQGAAAPHTAEADDLDRRRAEHPLVASVDTPSTDSAPTADEPPEGADAREGEL